MSDGFTPEVSPAVAMNGDGQRPVLLRQAREAAGLHIAALATALKVPVKRLEALEAGRYDELPDMVFARALASSACRQLKVDPVPILEQIPAWAKPPLGDSSTGINVPFTGASQGAPANPVGWLSRPAVLVAIALMLGALVLVFLPDMVKSPVPSAKAPQRDVLPGPSIDPKFSESNESQAFAVASVSQPVATADTAGSDGAAAPSPIPGVDTATAAATSQPTPATVDIEKPADPKKMLMIRASGDSWVEVTNNTGTILLQRLLKSGDVVDFSAAPSYEVVVGQVDNVEVLVRGRTFDAQPFARNGVARFAVR